MRAIIIQDSDASNLLDLLKLEKFQGKHNYPGNAPNVDERLFNATVDTVHRKFHNVVCRWLQEQGASVVR